MNEIANKFLLPEDKFMFKIRLRQPGYTYSACGSFTKNKGRIQKLKKKQEIHNISKPLREICPNMEFLLVHKDSVNLHIQAKYNKIWTRKNFVFGKRTKQNLFSI